MRSNLIYALRISAAPGRPKRDGGAGALESPVQRTEAKQFIVPHENDRNPGAPVADWICFAGFLASCDLPFSHAAARSARPHAVRDSLLCKRQAAGRDHRTTERKPRTSGGTSAAFPTRRWQRRFARTELISWWISPSTWPKTNCGSSPASRHRYRSRGWVILRAPGWRRWTIGSPMRSWNRWIRRWSKSVEQPVRCPRCVVLL